MAKTTEAEAVLDRFVEKIFKLMMDHHQRQVVELDLTLPQAQALKVLRFKPMCPGELAAQLRISAPAVTQLTDRLTRKHLIERRTVDGDRRSVMVALTDRGRRAVDRFRERRSDILGGALAHLSEQDRTEVVMALTKMVMALDALEAETAHQPAKASNAVGRERRHSQAVN